MLRNNFSRSRPPRNQGGIVGTEQPRSNVERVSVFHDHSYRWPATRGRAKSGKQSRKRFLPVIWKALARELR